MRPIRFATRAPYLTVGPSHAAVRLSTLPISAAAHWQRVTYTFAASGKSVVLPVREIGQEQAACRPVGNRALFEEAGPCGKIESE